MTCAASVFNLQETFPKAGNPLLTKSEQDDLQHIKRNFLQLLVDTSITELPELAKLVSVSIAVDVSLSY
jgi:hypothetical protein